MTHCLGHWGLPETSTLPYLVMSYIKTSQVAEEDNLTHNLSKTIWNLWENQVAVQKTNKSTEITIAANQGKKDIPLSKLVPEYATKYSRVFEKHIAKRFSPSRPWDHTINFKKEFEQKKALKDKQWGRIYSLSLMEKEELQKFIDENLAKGFI